MQLQFKDASKIDLLAWSSEPSKGDNNFSINPKLEIFKLKGTYCVYTPMVEYNATFKVIFWKTIK